MPLVHYSKWKKGKKFGPNALILDPDNYRLDKITGASLSEAQIIEQLVRREDIKGLATGFVNKGYMPVEDLIVIEKDGKKFVVEGNRRLCALKLLAKPKLAPKDSIKFFEKLKERAGDELPSQMYCVIAPNRTEANVYIFSKHADEAFSKRWQSIRQAAFVGSELSQGKTIEEVSDETGLSRGKIIESLTGLDIYRLAGTLELSDRASLLMTSATTFPFTALVERIFGTEEIRALLGVELTEHGIIGNAGTREEFLSVLKQIFEDVSEGTGDEAATRKYGTKDKALKRVQSFGYIAKGKSHWKAFRPEDVNTSEEIQSQPNSDNGKKKRKRKTKAAFDFLLPDDLEIQIGGQKLAHLIEEAQKINLPDYYHSSAVFLRCIIEIALNEAVLAQKCKASLLARHPKAVKGELSVTTLLEEAKKGDIFNIGLSSEEKRYVAILTKDGALSFDVFHLYIHNPHWPATYQGVSALRACVLPILRKALLKRK